MRNILVVLRKSHSECQHQPSKGPLTNWHPGTSPPSVRKCQVLVVFLTSMKSTSHIKHLRASSRTTSPTSTQLHLCISTRQLDSVVLRLYSCKWFHLFFSAKYFDLPCPDIPSKQGCFSLTAAKVHSPDGSNSVKYYRCKVTQSHSVDQK